MSSNKSVIEAAISLLRKRPGAHHAKVVSDLRDILAEITEEQSMKKHPVQPLERDGTVLRFKKNAIVEHLLDNGPFDMNKLAVMDFSQEDREQFAQLIGYSLGGFEELSYVSEDTLRRIYKKVKGGKDHG
jgi:hypothetical protein